MKKNNIYFYKKIKLIFLSLLLWIGLLFAHNIDEEKIFVRQSVNIEWNDAFTTIAEGMVFVWSDTRNGDRDIYAQLLSNTGQKLWNETGLMIDGNKNRQEDPVVTATSDGNIVIAYVDFTDHKTSRIIAQKISPAGEKLWGENGIVVCQSNEKKITNLNITFDKEGGVYIVWIDDRTGGKLVYAQNLSSSGNALYIENGLLIGGYDKNKENIAILPDGIGGIVIAFVVDDREITTETNTNERVGLNITRTIFNRGTILKMSRINQNGFVWEDLLLADGDRIIKNPKICADGVGGFILAWTNEIYDMRENSLMARPRNHNYDFRLIAQRISLAGNIIWDFEGVQINEHRISEGQLIFQIEEISSGGFTIVWNQTVGVHNTGFFAQRLDIHGKFLILNPISFNRIYQSGNTGILRTQNNFRLVKTDDDGIMLFFGDIINTDNSFGQLHIQKMNSDGTLAWDHGEKTILSKTDDKNVSLQGIHQVGDNYALIWTESNSYFGYSSVNTQLVSSNGETIFQENGLEINGGIIGSVEHFIVSYWNDFTYAVWYDSRHHLNQSSRSDLNQKLYYQIYDGQGNNIMPINGARVGLYPNEKHSESMLFTSINDFGEMCIVWTSNYNHEKENRFIQIINTKGERLLGDTGLQLPVIQPSIERNIIINKKDYGWDIFWDTRVAIYLTKLLFDTLPIVSGVTERVVVPRVEGISFHESSILPIRINNEIIGFYTSDKIVLQNNNNRSLRLASFKDDYLVFKDSEVMYYSETKIIKLDENGNHAPDWNPNGNRITAEAAYSSRGNLFLTDKYIVYFWLSGPGLQNFYVSLLDLEGNPAFPQNQTLLMEFPIYNQSAPNPQNPVVYQNNSEFTIVYYSPFPRDEKIIIQKIFIDSNQDINIEINPIIQTLDLLVTGTVENKSIFSPVSRKIENNIFLAWSVLSENHYDIFMNVVRNDGSMFYPLEGLFIADNLFQPSALRIIEQNDGHVAIAWSGANSSGKTRISNIYMKKIKY
ncbi:MAG: hypothetical protein FWG98_10870 [Candidatus Cloacimonetes bacterium]|nr:hypothetical protein [Candidatus Cloacimonadota bacterium]